MVATLYRKQGSIRVEDKAIINNFSSVFQKYSLLNIIFPQRNSRFRNALLSEFLVEKVPLYILCLFFNTAVEISHRICNRGID